MAKKPYFPNLEGEMAKNGIDKTDIAAELGITVRAISNKLKGKSALTWPQADKIQKRFFPDKEKDFLFYHTA